MRPAQGVYPISEDDDIAEAFMDFLHTRGSANMRAAGGPRAPQVYVSRMEGVKSHMAKTGSGAGVFIPVSHA